MVTWGAKAVPVPEAFGARSLHSCDHLFCAEMPWGLISFGSGRLISMQRRVQQVVATRRGFGFLADGDVLLELSERSQRFECVARGVKRLCASDAAVAALHSDGRVMAWGSKEHGGAVGDLTEEIS